jgi:hypothetical protein
MPALREECQEGECKKYTHHYLACQERVQAGNTQFKGEDCVEEMCVISCFRLLSCRLLMNRSGVSASYAPSGVALS